ncbi:hypothetical protein BN439_2535 [Erwinia amylovora Ea644]|nr:hypothetical protein BN439_2535 [Erwinia amylovora Ea644]CCP07621.1 hypothetical protein BN440_2604 [Erwinia amylovora MR1]
MEIDSDLMGLMALIAALHACASGVIHFSSHCAERVAERV